MRLAPAAGSLVLVVAVACGGGAAPTSEPTQAVGSTPGNGATPCPMTMGRAVDVVDFAFQPGTITITAGEVVTWANISESPHTVTFDDGTDCGRLEPDQGASRRFETAGTFTYLCAIHPDMRGSVVVQ